MKYRFVEERHDYSDLAAGRVFHSLPGFTPFPVRLASEIFQRCLSIRASQGHDEPCVLYDPCCGSGYLLAVLLYLHRDKLKQVIGSDINPDAVQLAERNLALLTPEGIAERFTQLEAMLASFGKPSHREALDSAARIQRRVIEQAAHTVSRRLFVADATRKAMVSEGLASAKVDIVVTDIPYGRHSAWASLGATSVNPITSMLDALHGTLSRGAVVAVASDKSQKAFHDAYRRVSQLQIGKRRVVFLTPRPAAEANT